MWVEKKIYFKINGAPTPAPEPQIIGDGFDAHQHAMDLSAQFTKQAIEQAMQFTQQASDQAMEFAQQDSDHARKIPTDWYNTGDY